MADEEKAHVPAVVVYWDAVNQNPTVSFDRNQVKHWLFVKSLLSMAKDAVDHQMKMDQVAALQQRQQDRVLTQKLLQTH